MSINPEHGFQFPGRFEISAMGAADADLELWVPQWLEMAGLEVERASLSVRASRAGNYVSVTVRFVAQTRADYEAAHAVLRARPEVRWTL